MQSERFNTLMLKPRLIDLDTRKRVIPMKVLCMGMSRTGTFSMWLALQKLGYKPYHMAEAMKNPERDFSLWIEALDAKYEEKSRTTGREEFDKILGDYDAVLDVPCALFIDELPTAYPEAKVILTVRPVESWLKSMANSVGKIMTWNWAIVSYFDPVVAGPWYRFVQCVTRHGLLGDSPSEMAKFYNDHYDHVREVVPKENILEFNLGDGWEPLCEFLGVPVPQDEKYPRTNEGDNFVEFHADMWYGALFKMVGKISAITVVTGAVVGTAWVYRVKGLAGFKLW